MSEAETTEQIGPYKVERELGRGAMGVVYLAHDSQLGRPVALKMLPPHLALRVDYLKRFEREARVLASLNHPNVASIHGLEGSDRQKFLVLEYVEGRTLSERLKEGPMGVRTALKVAVQIAAGLEAAHHKDVVHRDLKPANIRITPAGRVKVLDFGLAKSISSQDDWSGTRTGVLLGTVSYMSPEQASGRATDQRTDIWSFGCVLFECLTSRRAFAGKEPWAILAAIAREDPPWEALPGETPPAVRRLLERCLRKDADERLRDIGDAVMEIEDALTELGEGSTATTSVPVRRHRARRRGWAAALVLGMVCGVASWTIYGTAFSRKRPAASRARLVVPVPKATRPVMNGFPATVLSPDGRRLVYPVPGRGLFVRNFDDFEAVLLPGTDGARVPFFSSDGKWVGFFALGGLYKILLDGGSPVKLCDAPGEGIGASWGDDGTIVFAPRWSGGLWKIREEGGQPEVLTRPDVQKGEISHRWPYVLPGSKAVLLTAKTTDLLTFDEGRIAVAEARTGEVKTLLEGGMSPRFAASGHLVYAQGSDLLAVAFDPKALKVLGSPVRVAAGVETDYRTGHAYFDVSPNGVLLYLADGTAPLNDSSFVWVDRQGRAEPLAGGEVRNYGQFSISPDGRRIAASVIGANNHLWIFDRDRATMSRLSFGGGNSIQPVWSPDGERIAFASDKDGSNDIACLRADGGGEAEVMWKDENDLYPTSWSADGVHLAFEELDPARGRNVWILTLGEEPRAEPIARTSFREWSAVFSPDGRWIAYVTNETGRGEVVVQAFPEGGPRWQISNGGGRSPVWSPDGRELFYSNGGVVYRVTVEPGTTFSAGRPEQLFEVPALRAFSYDGERFLTLSREEPPRKPVQLEIELGWFEELRVKAPPAS